MIVSMNIGWKCDLCLDEYMTISEQMPKGWKSIDFVDTQGMECNKHYCAICVQRILKAFGKGDPQLLKAVDVKGTPERGMPTSLREWLREWLRESPREVKLGEGVVLHQTEAETLERLKENVDVMRLAADGWVIFKFVRMGDEAYEVVFTRAVTKNITLKKP